MFYETQCRKHHCTLHDLETAYPSVQLTVSQTQSSVRSIHITAQTKTKQKKLKTKKIIETTRIHCKEKSMSTFLATRISDLFKPKRLFTDERSLT